MFFQNWTPLLSAFLLIILLFEQIYIFRFMYLGYRNFKDKMLLNLSIIFSFFILGSFITIISQFFSFSLFFRGDLLQGIFVGRVSYTILGICECVALLILIKITRETNKPTEHNFMFLPFLLLGLERISNYVYIFEVILILIFIFFLFRFKTSNIFQSKSIHFFVVLLFSSKLILVIPNFVLIIGTISIILEITAFTALLIMHDIARIESK